MKWSERGQMAAVSLDTFAKAGKGTHDKREMLKKAHLQKLNAVQKKKKLLRRIDGKGPEVRDRVAELEAELFTGAPPPHSQAADTAPAKKHKKHKYSQAHADAPPQPRHTEEEAGPSQQHSEPEPASRKGLGHTEQHHRHSQPDRRPDHHSRDRHASNLHTGHKRTHSEADAHQGQHEGEPGPPAPDGKPRGKRPLSRVQRLIEEKKQAQADEAARKKEAQEARAKREAAVKEAQKHRTQDKKRFFKRTRTGQPLMRYRIEKILNQLQHE